MADGDKPKLTLIQGGKAPDPRPNTSMVKSVAATPPPAPPSMPLPSLKLRGDYVILVPTTGPVSQLLEPFRGKKVRVTLQEM